MTILEIDWAWGGMMTAVGMGVVFALLALLWALLWCIGRLDAAAQVRAARGRQPDADADPSAGQAQGLTSGDDRPDEREPAVVLSGADGLDDATVAAIAVAVIKHADIRRKQAAPEMRTNVPGSQLWASRWVAVGRALQNAPWRS